jgi:hypothetical protein
LLFLFIFSSVAENYWGDEITVRAKKTNLTHYDYIYFSIEALSTIGYGDAAADNSRVGVQSMMVTYLVSFLFRPVSEFLFYELFCYLYELYENHHRDAVPVVVNQIDNVEDANETHENDNIQ